MRTSSRRREGWPMLKKTSEPGARPIVAWCMALGLLALAGAQAAPPAAPSSEEADAHLAAGRFAEAAVAYESVVAATPGDGRGWFRLGFSRHALGHYREAIAAFARAEPLYSLPQAVAYRIARAHARLAETDQAFTWLERAVARGFNQVDQLRADPDLESLRADPRFAAILVAAAREASPCSLDPVYRAADFMLGEWQVMYQGIAIGHAKITQQAGGCAIVEEYTQPDVPGSDARVMTFFEPHLRRWRQVYVDGAGAVNELTGEATAGGLELGGEHHPRKGEPQRLRLTLEALAGGGFRQLSVQSRDGGKTWNPLYDIRYLPPAPAASP